MNLSLRHQKQSCLGISWAKGWTRSKLESRPKSCQSCWSLSPPTLSFSPFSVSPPPGVLSSVSERLQIRVRKFLLAHKSPFQRPPRGQGQGARPMCLSRSLPASKMWAWLSSGSAGNPEPGLCVRRTEQKGTQNPSRAPLPYLSRWTPQGQ